MNILKSMTLNNSDMINLDVNLENCPEKLAKIDKTVFKKSVFSIIVRKGTKKN